MRSNAGKSENSNSVDFHLPGFGGKNANHETYNQDVKSSEPLYEEMKDEGDFDF